MLTALWFLSVFHVCLSLKVLVHPTNQAVKGYDVTLPTLDAATAFVRPYLANMTSNVLVHVAPGTHTLEKTWHLSSEDSGRNGWRVIYQGIDGPVVSGGVVIRGWTKVPGSSPLWQASVPSLAATRQLYVSGQRRPRAQMPSPNVFGNMNIVADGYTISNSALASWPNPEDIELVYTAGVGCPGAPWTESRCGVSQIVNTHVIMKQPCWTNGRTKEGSSQGIGLPSSVENHPNLLAQPGQWFFNPRTKIMYYWPIPGENMQTIEVIAGSVESLLVGTEVHDVTVSGMVFAYATWMRPSGNEGFIEIQANWVLTGTPPTPSFAPGSVQFNNVTNMLIKNNTFIHLGAEGLVISRGSTKNLIQGNFFTDISGTGLRVGDVADANAPDRYNEIVSNSVWDVCAEFHGGVGIQGGYLESSSFLHNQIANLPYSGLSLGWGWGAHDQQQNNTVAYNNIHDTMGLLEDGGSIYVNGFTAGRCVIHDNWLWNYPALDTANLYLDNGSNNWLCYNNLVIYTSATTNWLYLQVDSSVNTVTANYYEPAKQYDGPSSNKVYNNIPVRDSNWPKECIIIMESAGPLFPFQRYLSHNLAFRRPAFASSSWSPAYVPEMAVDGDPTTLWSPSSAAGAAWFEVDLLDPFRISQVHILTRRDMYDPAWSESFEIWASNYEDMSKGHVVLGSQGSLATPFRGLWRLMVVDPTPYRYIAVVKTDGTHNLSFAELRVF